MAITILPKHDPYQYARPVAMQTAQNLDQFLQKRSMIGALPQGNIRDMLSALPAGSVNKILSSYMGQQMNRPYQSALDLAKIGQVNRTGRGGGLTPNAKLEQVNREMGMWRAMPENTPEEKKRKEEVYKYFSPRWNKVYGQLASGTPVDPAMLQAIASFGKTAGTGQVKETASELKGRGELVGQDLDSRVDNLPNASRFGDQVVTRDPETDEWELTNAAKNGKNPVDKAKMEGFRQEWMDTWFDFRDQNIGRVKGPGQEKALWNRYRTAYRKAFGEVEWTHQLPKRPPKKAQVTAQRGIPEGALQMTPLFNLGGLSQEETLKAVKDYQDLPVEKRAQIIRIIQNYKKAGKDIPWKDIVASVLDFGKK